MAIEKFDYIESQADADELIEEFGQIGAIVRTVMGPPPNEWTPGVEATVYHSIKVAVLPVNLQDAGKDIGGTLIKSSDQQALISPMGLSIEPTTTDVMLINGAFVDDVYEGGEAWTVISAKPLAPAGVTVLYDALVTR